MKSERFNDPFSRGASAFYVRFFHSSSGNRVVTFIEMTFKKENRWFSARKTFAIFVVCWFLSVPHDRQYLHNLNVIAIWKPSDTHSVCLPVCTQKNLVHVFFLSRVLRRFDALNCGKFYQFYWIAWFEVSTHRKPNWFQLFFLHKTPNTNTFSFVLFAPDKRNKSHSTSKHQK